MKILINGLSLEYQVEEEKTIGDILGSVEAECEKSGMTITGLKADGAEVPADKLDALFSGSPDSVTTIELSTISGTDLREMLRDLGMRFTSCTPQLQEIPVLLQTGKDMKVMETINSFSSDLKNLYQILPLLSITGLPACGPDINGIFLADYPAELSPILKELMSALESKDTILVGDLSEYELAPRIELLGSVLQTV
jgi:hypothetical protein